MLLGPVYLSKLILAVFSLQPQFALPQHSTLCNRKDKIISLPTIGGCSALPDWSDVNASCTLGKRLSMIASYCMTGLAGGDI